MARRKRSAGVDTSDQYQQIIEYYRGRLAEPAPPLPDTPWGAPVVLGPTWQRTPDDHWLLPKLSLGWDVLAFSGLTFQHTVGLAWRFTDEQARFLLWWYALNDDGSFVFRDGVLQRLKGWGKDPLGACLCGVEAIGPSRVHDLDQGVIIPTDTPNAWVQTAAVALEQTKNTMRLFPGLFTAEAKKTYHLQIGKEQVYALFGERFIQAVTSAPATLEGARSTFVLLNETQHWDGSNAGHEMAAVIERNSTKSDGGAARTLRITNAYEPSQDSVAQRDREAYEAVAAGENADHGLLYDSIEAPPDAPLDLDNAPTVIEAIRGDSVWLSTDRIVQSIADPRNPPSRSRRFWYNQIVAREDAWVVPQDFDQCAEVTRLVADGEEMVLFFDGSKSDDATGLVGSCVSDGHVVTLGMWQKPPGGRGKLWTAPRPEVDRRVRQVFEQHKIVAFFADPSHTLDDETRERYWDETIDEWHRRYKNQLRLWAQPSKHSVLWDMTSSARVEEFTAAAERCADDIEQHTLTHDGDGRLRIHTHNARRYPNRYGVSLWKGHRESPRKIDLAVCMVGARMLRRSVLNTQKPQRSGRVW